MKSKRLEEIVNSLDISTMSKAELVTEIDKQLACSKCRGSGLLRSPLGEEGGVKYCACPHGAERYEADRISTTNIIAPITREWRFFPADQYGTPEFLRLCMDQAKEQRAAGRLAIASALERYVESKRK